MSYLAIDEIRGKTSGTPTDVNDLKYQLATAWVNFDGTGTVSIRDSYNVSSITDLAVGDYRINFATAMDNTNFSVSSSQLNGSNPSFGLLAAFGTFSVGSVSVLYKDATSTLRDTDIGCVSIFGGKT